MQKKNLILAVALCLVLASPLAAQFDILRSCSGTGSDASVPHGSLIIKGSALYGVSYQGGTYNCGTIFKINVDGTAFKVLHHFEGGTVADGQWPYSGLVNYGTKLFGMTGYGGANGGGIIFKINTDGSGYAVLHHFKSDATDGYQPFGTLCVVGTMLYGMTSEGGASSAGTIFKIGMNGSGYTTIRSFSDIPDGAHPRGGFKYSGTKLYGTTMEGGAGGHGSVFKINPSGSGYSVLHSFGGGATDGSQPQVGNLAVSNGVIYGMTYYGGSSDRGVVYKINTSGTGFTILHSFAGGAADGAYAVGAPVVAGTKLYGVTHFGGPDNFGSLFKLNTNGTGYTVLRFFRAVATDGCYPRDAVVRKVTTRYGEMLYGVTMYGGTYDSGTVYSYKVR